MSDKLSALPLITTVQPDSRLYITDPAEAIPADRSKAIEWAAMARALGGAPTTDCELYVSKAGSDITGNGSILAPFLTIQAAINSVTDATADKQYTIIISPGIYTENLNFKPYVHVSAICSNGIGEVGKGPVRLDGSHTISFVGSANGILIISGVDINHSGSGNMSASGQGYIYYQNCRLAGFYYGNRSVGATWYYFISCLGESQISFTGADFNFTACQFGNNVLMGANNTHLGNTLGRFTACRFDALLHLRGVTGMTVTADVYACKLNEVRVEPISGTPTVIFNADSSYRPSLLNLISGTVTVNLQTEAAALKYTAADPADWAGSPPTTVQEAIDRIAAFNPGA